MAALTKKEPPPMRCPLPPFIAAVLAAAAATAHAGTVAGLLQGRKDVDHVVRAGAGQTLRVNLQSAHGALQFNVIAPGAGNVAMFANGSADQPFERVLPVAGRYIVRVYLVRAAARRGEKASYTLQTDLTGTALQPLPMRQDARVAGTAFHATAQVPCAPPYAPKVSRCDAGVTRYGSDGTASVTLRWGQAAAQQRRILFVKGAVVGSDAWEAPNAGKNQDVTTVRFGSDERYEIVDALLTGG
jgi:hypothetical protein